MSEKEENILTVSGEAKNLRTECGKHFRVSDGTFVALSYPQPVHTTGPDGNFEEIVNKIEKNEKGYRIHTGDVAKEYSLSLSEGKLFSIRKGPASLGFYALEKKDGKYSRLSREIEPEIEDACPLEDCCGMPLEEAADLRRNASELTYRDVFPHVSLRFLNSGFGIKESLVLDAPVEEPSFAYGIEAEGLKAALDEHGDLWFRDEEDKAVFLLPKPFMADAKGRASEKVSYSLEGNVLLLQADKEWLAEAAYPVVIDPSVELASYTYNNGLSSNFVSSTVNTPEGINHVLYSGYDQVSSSLTKQYHVVLGFDVLPTIPSHCTIARTVLSIQQVGYSGSEKTYGIYQMNMTPPSGCSSYADWIHYNLVWSHTTGSNVGTKLIDYLLCKGSTNNTTFTCDITRTFKEWYADSTIPHALCIKRTDLTNYAWAAFQGYYSASNLGPVLYLYYRNNVGLEDYLTRQSHSIDRAGTAYIGDYTGQLTLVKEDMFSASTVSPFSIKHIYNSAYHAGELSSQVDGASGFANMKVGKGWKLDCEQFIGTFSGGYLRWLDEDGTMHYFKNTSSGYIDEDGLGLLITKSNVYYYLQDRKGNFMYFSNGLLEYKQDATGNRITYVRDASNRIVEVRRKNNGGTSQTIATLSWDSNNYLTGITDSLTGKTTSYTYSSYGRLLTVTHPDGTTASYTYNYVMTRAKDNESGYQVDYTWDSEGRISGYTEKAGTVTGASVSVSGSDGITVYRNSGLNRTLGDSDDLLTGYVFDYSGRTVTNWTSSCETDTTQRIIYAASGSQYSANSGTSWGNNRLLVGGQAGARPVGATASAFSFQNGNLITNTALTNGTFNIAGSPSSDYGITQTLTAQAEPTTGISQDPKQSYILSGWAKAESVSLQGNRSFGLRAVVTYTDNTTENHDVSYCTDSTQWQYAVLPIVPKQSTKTVSSITVGFRYDRNANTADFKLGCLTREAAARYTYDSNGDLTSVTEPQSAIPTFSYSSANLTQYVSRGSGTYSYSYDNRHRMTSASNNGVTLSLSYDTVGNNSQSTLTGGSYSMKSSAMYDYWKDHVIQETYPTGYSTNYDYISSMSQVLGKPDKVTNAKGTVTNTSFDADNGRVTASSIPSTVSLAYSYSAGQLSGIGRTAGTVTQNYTMAHDGFGKRTNIKVGNRTLATYSYGSHNGVLNSVSYGNGQSVSYSRDNLERVTGVYYNGSSSPSTSYAYFGEGQLGSRTDHDTGHTYAYAYDGLNRLTAQAEYYNSNSVFSGGTTYDAAGRISQYAYALSADWSGTLSWQRQFSHSYNTDGTLAAVTSQFGTATYSYDGLKRLTSRSRNNGYQTFTRSYSYASGGNGGNTCPLVSSVSNGTFGSYSYAYDAVGNITSVGGSESASFVYDSQNQLTSETRNGTTVTYTYDGAGNLLSKSTGETYVYGDSDWKDLLTAYCGNSITYDTIGNPTVWYDGSTMTWTKGRRLASKGSVTFTYDAEGHRLTKTVNGVVHKYIWQGDRLISEQYGSNTLEFLYDESGRPVAVSVNGAVFEYITNLQGDILKVVYGGTGDVWAEYTYDAWGKVLTATGNLAAANPLRYRGYFYDTETELYYVHHRYYDPQLCRWINADSLASTGQGFLGCNMFAYCGNNPVNGLDKSGRLRISITDITGMIDSVESITDDVLDTVFTTLKDFFQSRKEKRSNRFNTVSLGFQASAGAGPSIGVSYGIVFDERGNIGFIVGGTGGGSLPSASVNLYISATNASSIEALMETTLVTGASGGEAFGAGGEFLIIKDPERDNQPSIGLTVFGGLAANLPVPIEFHQELSISKVWHKNVFDLLISACDAVLAR